MAHDTQWWKKTKKEKKCEHCGRIDICFEWQKEGVAKCGYNRLCETKCYEELVHHVHKQYITRRQFFPCLLTGIIGLFVGAGALYIIAPYLYRWKKVRIVTERERQVLTDWALSKAQNVSSYTIRQMVNTACESEFPALIMAIIGAETMPKFDPGSVSKAHCWGPMQVNPPVWVDTLMKEGIITTEKDLFDPVLGVRAGVYIFCLDLQAARGNLREATRRYLEGIHVKDPKGAAEYFDLIQKYLGEIYLALYRERQKDYMKGNGNVTEEGDN